MYVLPQKLKLLKQDLKDWNHQVFSNIFTKRQAMDLENATDLGLWLKNILVDCTYM
jgi:hypothetical protein